MKKINENTRINIEIDGIYCPECNELHPTLMWHEKYDEYLNKEDFNRKYKRNMQRMMFYLDEEDIIQEYYSHLEARKIEISQIQGKCVICGYKTAYKNIITSNYFCSDECKSKDV